jgi:hypothetical protein
VEALDLVQQRRGGGLRRRELIEAYRVADQCGETRTRHEVDGPLGDHEEVAATPPSQPGAQLLGIDGRAGAGRLLQRHRRQHLLYFFLADRARIVSLHEGTCISSSAWSMVAATGAAGGEVVLRGTRAN